MVLSVISNKCKNVQVILQLAVFGKFINETILHIIQNLLVAIYTYQRWLERCPNLINPPNKFQVVNGKSFEKFKGK